MYGLGLDYVFCAFSIFNLFRGRELEVRDDGHVVVAVGK